MNKKNIVYSTLIYFFTRLPLEGIQNTTQIKSIDSKLNFTELAKKYVGTSEDHNVITEDGYILKLFHIEGDRNKTVLLVHGIIDSADTFIIRGRRSLVAFLASQGYDVWIANCRGSKYSRKHRTLNPDTDNNFWDFSLHEIGVYDLPAIIDYILLKNGLPKLNVIAHSQGNMVFYVLGSTKPEYNEKINVFIALGPVCYLNKDYLVSPLNNLVNLGPYINRFLRAINQEEIFGENSTLINIKNNICMQKVVGYKICAEFVLAELAGEDNEELEYDFFYNLIGHYPISTSRKNVLHLMQISERRKFARFDYGSSKNLEIYGQSDPALYELEKISMKIALLVGRNDKVTPLENVEFLRKRLPNVVEYKLLDRKKFNHFDFVWGRHMTNDLFPYILEVLNKYVIVNSNVI